MSEKDIGETNEDSCLTSKFVESMNDDKFNPNFHNWSEKHFTVCASYSIGASQLNDWNCTSPPSQIRPGFSRNAKNATIS